MRELIVEEVPETAAEPVEGCATTAPARTEGILTAVRRRSSARPLLSLFVLALGIRVIAVLALFVTVDGTLFNDDGFYVRLAHDAAVGNDDTWSDFNHSVFDSSITFTGPLSTLARIFGATALPGQLFVALFGALTAVMAAKLASMALPRRYALGAGLLVALLPSQVLFSSLVLKDALVWAIVASTSLVFAKAAATVAPRELVARIGLITVGLVALGYLREFSLVVLTTGLILMGWVGARQLLALRWFLVTSVAVLVPWVIGYGPAGVELTDHLGSLEHRRAATAEGAATALVPGRQFASPRTTQTPTTQTPTPTTPTTQTQTPTAPNTSPEPSGDVDVPTEPVAPSTTVATPTTTAAAPTTTVVGLAPERVPSGATLLHPPGSDDPVAQLRYLPRGVVGVLLEPLPWRSGSMSVRLAQLESVVWLPMLVLAGIGVVAARRRLGVLGVPVLVAGGMTAVMALSEGNFGTAFRHRGEIVWIVAIASAAGLKATIDWWTARRTRTAA